MPAGLAQYLMGERWCLGTDTSSAHSPKIPDKETPTGAPEGTLPMS